MERVLIIGSPGSGKSTLAAEVARLTGLPLVHLDRCYWRPGWVEPDKGEWAAEVGALIERPRWVMDGNYGGTMALRLARADTVIDLDLPTWLCLARILRRTLRQFGQVRSDMPRGCPERLDWTFLAYTARFRRRSRPQTEARLAGFAGTHIRLRSPKEVRQFLDRLRGSEPAA
jgi:adenylate kinase family enzyme